MKFTHKFTGALFGTVNSMVDNVAMQTLLHTQVYHLMYVKFVMDGVDNTCVR